MRPWERVTVCPREFLVHKHHHRSVTQHSGLTEDAFFLKVHPLTRLTMVTIQDTPKGAELSVVLTPHQRTCSLKQAEITPESHTWSKCGGDQQGSPTPRDISTRQLLLLRLGDR